jgi:hypothetical protein
MGKLRLSGEEIAAIVFHLPEGAEEAEVCGDRDACPLPWHDTGLDGADRLVERRRAAALWIWPPFTKADRAILAESDRTGKTILELRKEGW